MNIRSFRNRAETLGLRIEKDPDGVWLHGRTMYWLFAYSHSGAEFCQNLSAHGVDYVLKRMAAIDRTDPARFAVIVLKAEGFVRNV